MMKLCYTILKRYRWFRAWWSEQVCACCRFSIYIPDTRRTNLINRARYNLAALVLLLTVRKSPRVKLSIVSCSSSVWKHVLQLVLTQIQWALQRREGSRSSCGWQLHEWPDLRVLNFGQIKTLTNFAWSLFSCCSLPNGVSVKVTFSTLQCINELSSKLVARTVNFELFWAMTAQKTNLQGMPCNAWSALTSLCFYLECEKKTQKVK